MGISVAVNVLVHVSVTCHEFIFFCTGNEESGWINQMSGEEYERTKT